MDFPYGGWLPELDMEEALELMNQLQQTNPYSELVDSFSSQSFQGYQNLVSYDQSINATTIIGDVDKQESYKATTTSSFAPIIGSTASTFTISFGDFTSTTAVNDNQLFGGFKRKEEMKLNELIGSIEFPKRGSSTRRNHRQAQEHILAERKRREKLTQRFISLSTLLPEIKKELEETTLSGKNANKELSTSSMRKSKLNGDHELYASFEDKNSLPCNASYNPGIKVRILGSNVLVRIYCQKIPPLALKALNEMERLHFTVISNSVLPISGTAALITIIAQMSEDFVTTAKDLVKCLQLCLSNIR
ncbi:hypothetical protein M8C21_022099 [Ambrosia artemisiifolia]|uniref:BHLH domain-containing protein n=1 Tax=Ambrosia artemisiifolia TaxID=4212 RepID=A0AAD5C6F3_AMBAR|nr:hypothetical protein M8C21_022099 [Ambrosia artemisiifolia]